MFFPPWGYEGIPPSRIYDEDYGIPPFFRNSGPSWGGRQAQPRQAQPRQAQPQHRPPPLFYWDQGRGLVPVSLRDPAEEEGMEDPQPDPSYFNPFLSARRPARPDYAPRAIPVRPPYYTSSEEPPEPYNYPFAAPRGARAPQYPPARNPRVSIPSSSSSISAAPPLKGYNHDSRGAHPYSEWGSTAKDSDDEEDVAAGSEPEAGADDDDDDDKTLVEELDPSVSLQQLLKQQKQAQQAQAEAQARELALQQQRQKLLRQQQRAASQQAQQQSQQAQQAALDQASRKSSGPIRIPVQLVNSGTGTKSAPKMHPKAQPRVQQLQQEPRMQKQPSTELALSPQPSELLQALSALLGGQERDQQQQKEQDEKERKLREQQMQREQQHKEQQQREQQQREQQEQAELKKKVPMSRSAAARVFQKVWRGRYLARQRPALRKMCHISVKLRENKQKLVQYTAGGSGLNHKQFLELNEGAMQAVLGLDNLPWAGEGQIPQELRAIKKQLMNQAMTLQDQVETLCSPAEKEKAFTRPDLRDPPEDNSRVRVVLVVEGQEQQQQPAARPSVVDGSTQTDQEPAPAVASHSKEALSADKQEMMTPDEATEEEDEAEPEQEGADFTFDTSLETEKNSGPQGPGGRGKLAHKRGKGRNNKANKGGSTMPHADGRQTVGAA